MCGGVVALVIIGFWSGADTFFDIIKDNLAEFMPEAVYQFILCIVAIIYYFYLLRDLLKN